MTTTFFPVAVSVTRRRDPNGTLFIAQVKLFLLNFAPLAVLRPCQRPPYHDAIPVVGAASVLPHKKAEAKEAMNALRFITSYLLNLMELQQFEGVGVRSKPVVGRFSQGLELLLI